MNTPRLETKGNVTIERDCIIEHEGKTYQSGGAVITPNYMNAYIKKTPHSEGCYSLSLTTWGGELLTDRVHETGKGSWGETRISFIYEGKRWKGRVIKDGDLVRASPVSVKEQTKEDKHSAKFKAWREATGI